jgi:hypothetical protein
MTSALTIYVDTKNAFAKIFGRKQLSLQNAKDRQSIADMLVSELSPENLTCDGELSHSAVRSRHAKLTRAGRELKRLDPTVKFYEFF